MINSSIDIAWRNQLVFNTQTKINHCLKKRSLHIQIIFSSNDTGFLFFLFLSLSFNFFETKINHCLKKRSLHIQYLWYSNDFLSNEFTGFLLFCQMTPVFSFFSFLSFSFIFFETCFCFASSAVHWQCYETILLSKIPKSFKKSQIEKRAIWSSWRFSD